MENFPANSNQSKRPAAPAPEKKVITTNVVRKKKPLGERIANDASSIWSHILREVLIPRARDVVYEAGTQSLAISLFGATRPTPKAGGAGTTSRVNYARVASGVVDAVSNSRTVSHRSRVNHNFDDIVIPDRAEAEQVIDNLFSILDMYGSVKLSDFYESVGITPEHTDNNYGWFSLEGAKAVSVPGGFLIDLPKPTALNKR